MGCGTINMPFHSCKGAHSCCLRRVDSRVIFFLIHRVYSMLSAASYRNIGLKQPQKEFKSCVLSFVEKSMN
jgi:hypothetical protein